MDEQTSFRGTHEEEVDMQKKAWIKPELIDLGKGKPEENAFGGCGTKGITLS